MARAKRHYISGYVWHITQRCHKREFLLKFPLCFENYDDFKDFHYKWIESAIRTDHCDKVNKWTQSIAVGSKTFIDKMKGNLGYGARGRKIICADDTFELREGITLFGNADRLDSESTYLWNQ